MKLYLNKKRSNGGYTLLEILLSVAIISIIAGLSIPIYQSFQVKNDLGVATETLANSLRRAQFFAQSGKGDENWGLRIVDGGFVLFIGNDYSSRNQLYDDEIQLSSTLNHSGLDEVVFQKFSGEPQSTGTITLTSVNGDSRDVFINSMGTVNY